MSEHVERVASRVPPGARPVAFVHDTCERSAHTPADVAEAIGLDEDECEALALLTKSHGESLLQHTRRIVESPRTVARELALLVKRADIEDHAARSARPGPDYIAAHTLVQAA
jgi:hypothetical protein